MDGQRISQSWQAGGEISPEGIGSGSLIVMLKEGEEGEANQNEVQLLSTRDRKERGPTAFCRQACSACSAFSQAVTTRQDQAWLPE